MLNSSQAAFQRSALRARSASHRFCTRLFAASLAVSALAWSSWASALGLGEITLHSALNQPLNAEIQLVETAGLDADDIVVRLASAEAFTKAGIERGFFLNDLRFTAEVRGNRGLVRVVSSKAVTEPYLNFLVQLTQPNGDQFHEYTLLLDPPTSPEGLAATRSRQQPSASDAQSRMPVAPPPAVQGKRYTVAGGDTLNGIARRVLGRGSDQSTSQMADAIRALNPQAFPGGAAVGLKAGQGLLLPDTAVVPTQAAPAAAAAATGEADEMRKASEQLAASTLESQQLARAVEELTARAQALQEEMASKDKEITSLRADLAQAQAPAPAPVPAAPPAAAPVAAAPAVQSQPDSFLSLPLLLGILALLLLLVAYALSKRRQQRQAGTAPVVSQDDLLIKPAQTSVMPVHEVPAVAPQPLATAAPAQAPVKPAATPRHAGGAPDALDGVSIYIAYGRFSEAMGILRNALETQPEREDIRIRILELLAEQGDVTGFLREEQSALEQGVEQHKIDEIRARYPQLKASQPPAPAVAPMPLPVPVPVAPTPVVPEMDLQLDETTAAALNPEPIDEFQLNLDDLSMDADWDLVDPFDAPPVRPRPPAAQPSPEVDPGFSSNLTELPEVFELSDEQFLSDFEEPEPILVEDDNLDASVPAGGDALSDEFLDSFMGDDSEFDLLDLDEAPLTQINQAQMLIDDGDFDAARDILHRVIEESDEQHRQMAREMLAGIS
ncbi:peptigoglycan-binding protein LysM [Pseudomonas sp. v388]|uniref:FimV/HubP family polar landmark protein n=1 Tax=Pseudomonas sp. v388 TaxID=2479849 RepID=UPI000F77C003|nr:FimV/HubP family polar landmark protein [Pseudomonas sp. v388]RRV07956.1 peptigoglycan-binding protein LysM [Pseudomonas sp. v388]